MTKNLKRGQGALGEGTTPGRGHVKGGVDARLNVSAKRHKQSSITAFLQSPADANDTPTLFLGKPQAPKAWPTTAQRALENFKIKDTPAMQAQPMPPPKRITQEPLTQGRCSQGVTVQFPHHRNHLEEDEDDFFISMSQTYERSQPDPLLTFRANQDPELSLGRSQHAYLDGTQQNVNAYVPWGVLEGQDSNEPGQPDALPHGAGSTAGALDEALPEQHDLTGPIVMPTASTGPAVTPELGGTLPDVQDDGTTPPPDVGPQQAPLFNIFAPNRGQQTVVLIRHGESEFNEATHKSTRFHDIDHIYDARLTELGVKQACALRPKIAEILEKHTDVLFVVSALTRAMQTFLRMNPYPERLPSKDVSRPDGQLNVLVTPLAAEYLQTTGDVGRPRTALVQEFPELSEQLHTLPERWWYEDPKKPNCADQCVLGSKEGKKAFEARVSRLRQFLRARPEKLIVVVGHACLFKALARQSHYMKNCEMSHTLM